jgi:acyl-CoA synthetase (AMP-forming)/AMP-acid ligase II
VNVADYLLECADPRTIALVSESRQFSYAELQASAARSAGVVEGDHVGLLAHNSLFWVAACLGIPTIGAVLVPFSSTAKPQDINAHHMQPKLVVLGRLPVNPQDKVTKSELRELELVEAELAS